MRPRESLIFLWRTRSLRRYYSLHNITPMKALPVFSALLLAPLLTLSARAGLEFEAQLLERTARHADTEVSGEFKFKVTGDRAVTIKDIASYCSCLKAGVKVQEGGKEARREYKPGETGVIEAKFLLGTFEGEVTKQVDVITDDPAQPEIPLAVKVTIPPIFKMEPESLKWEIGEEAKPKTIRVTVLDEKEIAVTALESSRENMAAAFKEVKKGREYEITLTPKTTAEPMLGVLRVETDAPYSRYTKRLLFFSVTKPRPEAAQVQPPPQTPPAAEAPKNP